MAQREFIMGLVAGGVVVAVGAILWQSGVWTQPNDTSEAARAGLRGLIEAPVGDVPRALPDDLRTADCGFGVYAQRALDGTVRPQTVQAREETSALGLAVMDQLRQATTHTERTDIDESDFDFNSPEAQLAQMLEATRCKRITGVVGIDVSRVRTSAGLVAAVAKYRASQGDFRQAHGWAFGLWAFGQDLRATAPADHDALGAEIQLLAVQTVLYLLQEPGLSEDEAAEANIMARRLIRRSPPSAWTLGHVATGRLHEAIDSSQARELNEQDLTAAVGAVVANWASVIRAADSPGELVPDLSVERADSLAFAQRAAGSDQLSWVAAHRALTADTLAVVALSKMRSSGVEPELCQVDLSIFPEMYDPTTAARATWDAELCGMVMGERAWSLRRGAGPGNRFLDLSGG